MYRPFAQSYSPRVSLLVRTSGTPADALAIVRHELRALDAGMPVFNVAPLEVAISVSLLPARIAGALLGTLGVLALVLAGLGVYGVLSFLVRARTREIGVRVALGAAPGSVVALVLRQALGWTVTGLAIGMALALVASRFVGALLYGVSPTDALTFGGVLVTLATVACLAALVPAVRASRLDPLVALRDR